MKTRVLNNKKQSEFSQEITRISVLKFTKKYHTKNIQINKKKLGYKMLYIKLNIQRTIALGKKSVAVINQRIIENYCTN